MKETMKIITSTKKEKCCKCEEIATHTVIHKNQMFHVCDLHKPSSIEIMKANGHIQNLKGKDYVLLSGLLDLAHKNGLESMSCEILEYNLEERYCITRAIVSGKRGTYIAHGDSTPQNTGKLVSSAFIRMSETRAYCRALRLYTGTGMTARDELPS